MFFRILSTLCVVLAVALSLRATAQAQLNRNAMLRAQPIKTGGTLVFYTPNQLQRRRPPIRPSTS